MTTMSYDFFRETCGPRCATCRAYVTANEGLMAGLQNTLGDGYSVFMAQTGGHTMCIKVTRDHEEPYVLVTSCEDEHDPDPELSDPRTFYSPFMVGRYDRDDSEGDVNDCVFQNDLANEIRKALP
jgi:hypothetical protein